MRTWKSARGCLTCDGRSLGQKSFRVSTEQFWNKIYSGFDRAISGYSDAGKQDHGSISGYSDSVEFNDKLLFNAFSKWKIVSWYRHLIWSFFIWD